MTLIYHAAKDENNKYHGGKAGDQTGTEVYARSWYSRPWTEVYEPPTAEIGEKVAKLAKDACDNNNIGYDQYNRNTLLARAKETNWDLTAITTPCECDCSSLAAVLAMATGASEDVMVLSGNCVTTRTIGNALVASGWKKHTDEKYLISADYLGKGWMLNYPGHHIAINGATGRFYNEAVHIGSGKCPYTEPTYTLRYGMRGTGVSWLQWHLNKLIATGILKGMKEIDVDGDFGSRTLYTFKVFQKYYPKTGTNGQPDGLCGSASRKKLKSLIK